MENNQSAGVMQLRRLRMLHRAIFFSLLFFFLITLLLNFFNGGPMYDDRDLAEGLLYANLVMLALALPAAGIVFRKKRKEIPAEADLTTKLTLYQSPFVIRLALWEVPAMAAVIFFMMTGMVVFAGILIFMLVVIILGAPGKGTLLHDLEPEGRQREELLQMMEER